MFRGELRDKDNYLLMEKFGYDLDDVSFWDNASEEVLRKGGKIISSYVGVLQKVESEDGFI